MKRNSLKINLFCQYIFTESCYMPDSIIPQNLWVQWWTRHVQISSEIVQRVHPPNSLISFFPSIWTSDHAISTFQWFCMDLSSSHHHLQAIWTKRSQVSMHREVIHLHHPSGAPLNGCETFQQTFQLAPEHHTEPSLNLVQEFSFVVSYSRATLLKSCMWAEEG